MAPEAMQPIVVGRQRPSRRKDGTTFEFINDTSTPDHRNARTVIRRQAARSGARLRKTRGAESKTPPEHEEPPGVQEGHNTTPETLQCDVPPLKVRTLAAGAVKQPSLSRYEAVGVNYNFDVTALASFINVDFAVIGYQLMLQGCLDQSGALLQNGDSSSFLAHLPARYGSSPFLDDAVHCVAARAAQMLGRPTASTSPSLLYGKALRSLSDNIQSGSWADVYCATRLFVLYESLGVPDVNALAFHHKAGINLLRRMGPPHNSNSFDCMLFKSQGPQILISEIHEKRSSMFETQGWQDFFEDAACKAATRDTSFLWRLLGATCFLAGILKDARNLFCATTLDSSEYVSKSSSILQRVERTLQALLSIHEQYKQPSDSQQTQLSLCELPDPSGVESPDRIRLRQFAQFPVMFLYRLRASLSSSEADRAASEEDAQRSAAQMLHIEKKARNVNPNMAWHFAQRNIFPYSIIRTREDWLPISEPEQNWEGLRTYLAERWLKWDNSWHDNVLDKELGEGNSE